MICSGIGAPERNLVMLTGYVLNSPQFHHQLNGTPVLQFLLKMDDPEDRTEAPPIQGVSKQPIHRPTPSSSSIQIVAFGTLARERALLQSGQRLFVKGRLTERRWKLADGRVRSRLEVIASELMVMEEFQTHREEKR